MPDQLPNLIGDGGRGVEALPVASVTAAGLVDIAPSDTVLEDIRGLLVTVAGNLSIVCSDGSAPTAFPVSAGQTIPVAVQKVLAATTATVKGYKGYYAG